MLISLADQANDSGVCWPSVGTLTKRTCLSERAVQRALANLEALGHMTKDERAGRSTVFKLHLKGDNLAPNPRQSGTPRGATQSPGGANVAPRTVTEPSKTEQARGTRLPPDWKPTPELQAWARAERPDIDLPQVAAMFADHWRALPGARGVKLDWPATFRNWIRKERPAAGARTTGPAPKVKTCARGAECLAPGPMGSFTRMRLGDVCQACRQAYMDGKWRDPLPGQPQRTLQ